MLGNVSRPSFFFSNSPRGIVGCHFDRLCFEGDKAVVRSTERQWTNFYLLCLLWFLLLLFLFNKLSLISMTSKAADDATADPTCTKNGVNNNNHDTNDEGQPSSFYDDIENLKKLCNFLRTKHGPPIREATLMEKRVHYIKGRKRERWKLELYHS